MTFINVRSEHMAAAAETIAMTIAVGQIYRFGNT
jgi:hypothetical protein